MSLASDERRYIELLSGVLLDTLNPVSYCAASNGDGTVSMEEADPEEREEGRDWPWAGLTMIGEKRLLNLEALIRDVVAEDVPGHFIETGVWRGGASIFARALFDQLDHDREVWLCDSFEGLPAPDAEKYAADEESQLHRVDFLSVSQEQVMGNFRRLGISLKNVRFIKGWFRDTLPNIEGGPWSVLRLDGDLYESTMIALESLYPNLSPGGYIIIDDYGCLTCCKQAVHDYREREGIDAEIIEIDWTGAYWQKPA